MKRSVLVLGAVALLLLLPTANADAFVRYKMTYRQALRATEDEAQYSCERVEGCRYYQAGPCARQSLRRFNCAANYWFPPVYVEEAEVQCTQLMKWGIRAGFIKLLGTTEAECF